MVLKDTIPEDKKLVVADQGYSKNELNKEMDEHLNIYKHRTNYIFRQSHFESSSHILQHHASKEEAQVRMSERFSGWGRAQGIAKRS
jgi:hypothetical protein